MSEKLAAIGDVHGDASRLKELLSKLDGRHVVMVGDYINRGPDSRKVLDLLVRSKRQLGDQLTLLAGNHELALLDYLDTADFVAFAAHGGMATIRSYVGFAVGDVRGQLETAIPAGHLELLRGGLRDYYETDAILISHSGFDPGHPNSRETASMVRGSFPEIFRSRGTATPLPKPSVICGHYVQSDKRPYVRDGLICIDTGCGTIGGPLTAVLWPELDFISV